MTLSALAVETAHHPVPAPHLAHLSKAYRLGLIRKVTYLPLGLMNQNWRLDTDAGSFALKRIVDVPIPVARRNLSVLAGLAAHGVPSCPPRRTTDDDTVTNVDGVGYCLLPWVAGTHIDGTELTPGQAHELGVTVGQIHHALNESAATAELPSPTAPPRAKVIAPETAHADADRYLQAAAHGHTPFDRNVVTLLTERKRLIDMYAHQRPITDEPAGPVGWTHGDLQHRNILWGGHRVAAVLDWDRIRIRPFAEEIVRTATIQFGSERARLDLSRAGAFIRGYRTVIAIDDADLADGLHRLWWKRMADFWHLDFHYDRNDSSCDALFLSGEAFLRWWTEYRDAVLHALLAPHGGRGSETAGAPFIEAGGVLPAR